MRCLDCVSSVSWCCCIAPQDRARLQAVGGRAWRRCRRARHVPSPVSQSSPNGRDPIPLVRVSSLVLRASEIHYRYCPETANPHPASNIVMFAVVDSSPKSSHSKSRWKWWLLDLPLWVTLGVASTTYAVKVFYHGPMQTLIESYRRSEHNDKDRYGYYTDFFPDVTYYARKCDDRDVTTHDSNDIVVPSNVTMEEAADTMMTHGALLFQEILTPQTAQQLRDYLETRNRIQDQLSWFEKFWGDIGRLSLGLGVDDAPIIAQALQEVGNHQALHTALEAIVGPDPAIVEISTLTTMQGAQPQGTYRTQTVQQIITIFILLTHTYTFTFTFTKCRNPHRLGLLWKFSLVFSNLFAFLHTLHGTPRYDAKNGRHHHLSWNPLVCR